MQYRQRRLKQHQPAQKTYKSDDIAVESRTFTKTTNGVSKIKSKKVAVLNGIVRTPITGEVEIFLQPIVAPKMS